MPNNHKDLAVAQFTYLKRRMYELGMTAQSLVNSINEETETFLSNKDFTTMDFKKVEELAKELQTLQKNYKDIVAKFEEIKETYNLSE